MEKTVNVNHLLHAMQAARVDELLSSGKKVQLEFVPKENEIRVLTVSTKKIKLDKRRN